MEEDLVSGMRDWDIREALKNKNLKSFYLDGSRVVEEMAILWGDARVDIAVINGSLHAYEIKSELDNLSRFEKQYTLYNKVFDYCTLVLHEKHYKAFHAKYEQLLPNWGTIIVKKEYGKVISELTKKPEKNTSKDIISVCYLLWKSEIFEIIDKFDVREKGLSNKKKKELYQFISEKIDHTELEKAIREKLKNRKEWRLVKEKKSKPNPFLTRKNVFKGWEIASQHE